MQKLVKFILIVKYLLYDFLRYEKTVNHFDLTINDVIKANKHDSYLYVY